MPGIRSTTPCAAPKVPLNGHYPKILRGRTKGDGTGGSVWLVTAPNTGIIINLAARPQKAKHKLGYYTTRLVEAKMDPYTQPVTLQQDAA